MKLNLPSLLTRLRSNTTSSGTAGRWKGSLSRYAAAAPSKILARSSRSVASDPGSLQQQFELMPNLLNSAMVWPALMDSLRMPLQLSSSADVIGFVEEADCYKINVELPGLSPNNVSVSVKDNSLLWIQAEKRAEEVVGTSEQQGAASGMKHPTTTTDSAFSFQRAMTIPEDCFTDPAHISADMKHGLLCIKIEKKPILTGTAEMAAGGDVGVKIPINKQQLPPLAASLTEEELETDRFKDTLSS